MSGLAIQKDCRKSTEISRKSRVQGNKFYNGQDYHDEREHLRILALYNKSAALAENNSEELALAINDRSVLLMHLHQYDESLNDIEKSYQITKSDELKAKLLARKMNCLTLRDKVDKDRKLSSTHESPIPVIENVSRLVSCAANCISICYGKNYGRLIMATKDIEIGTIIAKEKAIVSLPKEDKIYTNCSHCLMLACNGVPCDSCASIIYCSEKCKEEAWLEYHDVECSILPGLDYSFCKHLIFAFRLLIKFIKKEGLQNIVHAVQTINSYNKIGKCLKGFYGRNVFHIDKFQTIYNLSHNTKNISEEQGLQVLFIPVIKDILKQLTEKTNIFNDYNTILNNNEDFMDFFEKVVYKLMRIINQNFFAFQDESYVNESKSLNKNDQKVGAVIAPFCSLFNHSCDQNTGTSFTKNQEILIYAIKPIKKGEQIFTNYSTPLEMEKHLRNYNLKSTYNFICKCEPCENNWPTNFILPKKIVCKVASALKREGIFDLDLRILDGNFQDDVYNETTLEQVIKMYIIIHERYPSKASLFTVGTKSYFHRYYDKLYSIRSLKIFDSC